MRSLISGSAFLFNCYFKFKFIAVIKNSITAALVLLFLSCSNDKSKEVETVENAAKNTESSLPIKRLSRSQDILDGIYDEYIKSHKDLEHLDAEISRIQDDKQVVVQIYDDVTGNSEDYYDIAVKRAISIKDSGTRKEILALLKNSEDRYSVKTKKLDQLKREINRNALEVSGLYNVFKIRKTLGEIEKYQNAHPIETASLENFIRKQKDILNKLKNLK